MAKNPEIVLATTEPRNIGEGADLVDNGIGVIIKKAKKNKMRLEAIKLLVNSGADPKFSSGANSSPNSLISDPENLTYEELSYLLSSGADPDFGVCVPGQPPLFRLAEQFSKNDKNHDKIAKYISIFVENNADPKKESRIAVEYNGKNVTSAWDIAEAEGSTELKTLLTKKEQSDNPLVISRGTPTEVDKKALPLAGSIESEETSFGPKALFQMGELLYYQQKPEAIECYEKAGAAGYAFAYYRLGNIYYRRRLEGVERNISKAIEYYKKAASRKELAALEDLGEIYQKGEGVEKNLLKAAEYYRIAADEGIGCPGTKGVVQAKLAKMYAIGEGVPKNLAKAISYAEKSWGVIQIGTSDLIFADIYRSQAEAEPDPVKAKALYVKAAKVYADVNKDKNEPAAAALYQLGRLFASGKGVVANKAEAERLIKEAADQNYPLARFEIERPVAKLLEGNSDQAMVDLIRSAAEGGHPQAQYEYGTMFEFGHGVGKSQEEAIKWYKLSANQNNAAAQYALGKMYATGDAVKKSSDRAFEYFKKAADQKHPAAIFEVAKYSKNDGKAVELYMKAAESGESEAQYALGKMFATGRGVPVDFTKSSQYYRAAADQGDLKSQLVILKMFFRIHNRTDADGLQGLKPYASTDSSDIFRFAKTAAEKAGPLGQYYLGMCYSDGIGVEKNPAEALVWLGKASGAKNVEIAQ